MILKAPIWRPDRALIRGHGSGVDGSPATVPYDRLSELLFLHGKRDHIPGFVSQREAQRWIEEKAPTWLLERRSAPGAFGRLMAVS